MPDRTKIATCCYCGSRTMLTLKGKVQHHLACSACGAPLSRMKAVKAAAPPDERPRPKPARPVRNYGPPPGPPAKPRRGKRRKPLVKRLFDRIEDAVEEIVDIFD